MKNWCRIVEKDDIQYLISLEYNAEDDMDEIKVTADLSEYYECGIVSIGLSFNETEKAEKQFNQIEKDEMLINGLLGQVESFKTSKGG